MRRGKPQPIARFRVYAWKSSLYFLVVVWRTKKDLLTNRVNLKLAKSNCEAHVLSYDNYRFYKGQAKKLPIVGEIHFHKRKLGTEIVTHESFHALASLMRRLKFDFSKLNNEGTAKVIDPEEVAANIQGKLARSIVMRLYDLKLF